MARVGKPYAEDAEDMVPNNSVALLAAPSGDH